MRSFKVPLLLTVMAAMAAFATAQAWSGPAAVGLQVSDRKGHPIAAARVTLELQAPEGKTGPPPVETDAKGRAVVANLAPGTWQVEVSHPDYLSYVAVIDLVAGKKPAVSASFLQAGGTSLTPMKVKIVRGNPSQASPPLMAASPPPTPAPAEPAAPQPAPVPAREEAPAVEPSAEVHQEPPLEPEPEIAEVVVEPTPAPAAEPVVPAPVIPEPAPDPEPAELRQPAPVEEPEVEMTPAAPEARVVEPEPVERPVPVMVLPPEHQDPEPEPEPVTTTERAPAESDRGLSTAATAPPPPPVPVEPEVQEVAPEPQEASVAAEEIAAAAAQPEPEVTAVTPEPEEIPAAPAEPEPETQEVTPEVQEVPAPPVSPPPAEPEPQPEPEPEVLSVAAAVEEAVVEVPTAEPEVSAAPELVAPAETVEAETPPPPPAPAPAPAATAPATILPAPPALGPGLISFRDDSCIECKTGEWSVVSTLAVGAAIPGSSGACPSGLTEAAQQAAELLGRSTELERLSYAGPAFESSPDAALAVAEADNVSAVQNLLAPFGASSCGVVAAVLPRAGRFVGFQYGAADDQGGGRCLPEEECEIGQGRWFGSPEIVRGPNATVLYGIFQNLSVGRERRAELSVFFRPPTAFWRPPAER
ncbi:MAG: carboxypeptidase regulatory-like domain-containing protein [Thermoanaerobaculia bacterium]